MNIGISLDMVNVHHQEPNRNRYESKYYWDELYPMIAAAGFTAVEIPFDPFWIFRGGSGVPFTKYCVEVKFGTVDKFKEHLFASGIEKITGIHFNPTIFMRNDNLDFYFGASTYFGGEAIRYAAVLGCEYITISPTPPYGLVEFYHGKNEFWDREFIKRSVDLINHFARIARENSIKIILKNEFWSIVRLAGMDAFMAQVDDSILLDLDVAHATIAQQPLSDFLAKYAPRLGCVHLTDTSFVDDAETWKTASPEYPKSHPTQVFRDLGQGSIDWNNFFNLLQTYGYKGDAIVSCRQTREPMRALLRSRSCLNTIFHAKSQQNHE